MTHTVEASPQVDLPDDLDPRLLGIQAEAKLRDWQIRYDYVPDLPLADVRAAEWAQVRSPEHVHDRDAITEYRTQMAQGAVFPPILVMSPDVLVDGNTRADAARALKRKTIPAFVAHFPTVDLAKSFAAAMNQLGGRRLTPTEAYDAAVVMLNRDMPDESVAREIGRSVEMVRQMRRQKEFEERAAAQPEIAAAAAGINQKSRIKLAQITHDPAFVEAVKVVAESKPSAATVSQIVKAATSARTDTEAIEAVRAIRAELAPAGPPPIRVVVSPQVQQSRMQLGALLKYADNPLLLLDTGTPEVRATAVERWTRVRELADEVLRLYGG